MTCVLYFTVQEHPHETQSGPAFATFLKDQSSVKQKSSSTLNLQK